MYAMKNPQNNNTHTLNVDSINRTRACMRTLSHAVCVRPWWVARLWVLLEHTIRLMPGTLGDLAETFNGTFPKSLVHHKDPGRCSEKSFDL
jgi:hypothetical protein